MSSLRARLAVLPRGAAANGQPRWLRRQSCCTKTCWTIQSAAERRGLPRAIRRDAALRQGAAAGCRSLSGSIPFSLPRHVLFSGRSLRSARTRQMRASACEGFGPPHLRAISVLPAAERRNLPRAIRRIADLRQRAAAGCCAIARTRSGRSLRSVRHERTRVRPADGCDVEPSAFMRSSHGQQLAKGRPMRAFAGRSCGPPR